MSTEPNPHDSSQMRRSPEEIAALMKILTQELTENVTNNPEIISPREGYAMLVEDLEVVWDAIKAGDAPRALASALSLSTTAAQFVLDHTVPGGIIRIYEDHERLVAEGRSARTNPLASVKMPADLDAFNAALARLEKNMGRRGGSEATDV